ncbi:MAG TPA: glycosyltransferase [Candidatus Saccharimonadales bacterium]
MIMLLLLAGALAVEVLMHLFSAWPHARSLLAWLGILAQAFAAGSIFAVSGLNVFTLLLALFGIYRVFNLLRVIERRMHEDYLRRATRGSSIALSAMQLAVAGLLLGWEKWHTTGRVVWAALCVSQAIVGLIFMLSVGRTMRRTQWPRPKKHYADADLPAVTVAIPARNETEDLEQCLQSIIASDYPKLEVIVLDDCSQNSRTPEIIRDFAHAGVRFIQGKEPQPTWLPKNQAYERIAAEASGAYILFCGVDVRFMSDSLRMIVSTMLDRDKQMISILPRRQESAYGRLSLIQAMRYWWELVPPRRTFRRPPVISSCWVITAEMLKKAGGFAAIKRSIVPEAYFAREAIKQNDGYSFLRSDGLGVESNKTVSEQRATAIRMRYPQLHRRPEQVALAALWELIYLVLPFVLAVGGFWWPIGAPAHVAAILASVYLVISYEYAVLSTRVNTWWFGLFAQPFAVMSDIILIHYSMWRYEFASVDWKGRNVCVPVMHVVPSLPPLYPPKNNA